MSIAGPDFDTIFQQHWARVCETLYRLTGDMAEAEDLALEVFVRLHDRPPRDQSNLGGWLYRVAMNLGFNALRARSRRQRYEDEAGIAVLVDDPARDPSEEIERAQERGRVREALRRMPVRQAKLLILQASGLSYRELAAALNLAPGSVGTLLARAGHAFEKQYRSGEGEQS